MSPDRLSATFAALADPTRRAILARLASGATSVMKLAKPFEISLPAVSKHLKVLERAGLIERGREAQWRPCRLQANPLKDIADWVEYYRRHWEESFDRLDRYLKERKHKKKVKEIQRKEKKGAQNTYRRGKRRAARRGAYFRCPGRPGLEGPHRQGGYQTIALHGPAVRPGEWVGV